MQGLRVNGFAIFRIAAKKSTRRSVVVSGAEIVEAEVGVVLFAAIEVIVRTLCPTFVNELP